MGNIIERAVTRASPSNQIPIGRFARITGISISALRFYDEHALFRPATVNPQNGYRYYNLEQLDMAVILRLLRDLEVPLPEIKALFSAGRDEIYRVLEIHRQRMVERQLGINGIVARLDQLLDNDRPMLSHEIQVVQVESMLVASKKAKRTRPNLDATIVAFARELHASLPHGGVRPHAREVILYHDLLQRHEIVDFEVCVPAPEGVCDSWELPGGTAARTTHYGAWTDIWASYAALLSWIVRQQHGLLGPLREVYLVDERDTSDPRDYVTELTWLIGANHN
jgi:DNA-binding transcriptional MerR regulator